MTKLSNKEIALLGLLTEKSIHPYAIEQEIKSRSMREWTDISFSSIYKILTKLEKKGIITSKINLSKNNISQKKYFITKKGKEAYKETISEILGEPEKIIYRIDLAISHLGLLPTSEAIKQLEAYRQKLIEGFNCYKELEKYMSQNNCCWYTTGIATRPQYLIKGEIEWIDDYIKGLKLSQNEQ